MGTKLKRYRVAIILETESELQTPEEVTGILCGTIVEHTPFNPKKRYKWERVEAEELDYPDIKLEEI